MPALVKERTVGDRAGLSLEAIAEALGRQLDRDMAPEAWIVGPVDDAHTAGTERRFDDVRAQLRAWRQIHERHPTLTARPSLACSVSGAIS
jgi:cell wall assembly regulator SMI1